LETQTVHNILPRLAALIVETGIRTEGKAKLEARSNYKKYAVTTEFPSLTAFLQACERGHTVCVELLILAGCDTMATDALGRTGLMLAASKGHTDVVQKLLELRVGGSIEIEVAESISFRDFDCTRPERSLKAGGHRKNESFRAFHYACLNGHVGCVDALLTHGCDITAIAGQRTKIIIMDGTSGLMMAVSKGHTDVVARLLQHPAAADLLEVVSGSSTYIRFGGTPFLRACDMANVELMQLLVSAGCDTTVMSPVMQHNGSPWGLSLSPTGFTGSHTGLHVVIMSAAHNRKLRELSGPLGTSPDLSWLLEADPMEALKLLLQQDGISEMVGVQDATGKTVIERAIDEGEMDCAALLIRAVCNRHKAGGCGATGQPLELEPEPSEPEPELEPQF
jgi:ankyrin repeat protein